MNVPCEEFQSNSFHDRLCRAPNQLAPTTITLRMSPSRTSVSTTPSLALRDFGMCHDLENMNIKASIRLLVVIVMPLTLLSISCSSESSSNRNEVELLRSRIEELEAELRIASSNSVSETDQSETSSSTPASESASTASMPASMSRETLAALKDCHSEAFGMVNLLEPNGEVDAVFDESSYSSELFWTGFDDFREACREAAVALDVDMLELGASCCDEDLVRKLQEFNMGFVGWQLLEMAGERPGGLTVFNWENVREFPQYLADLLESYRRR